MPSGIKTLAGADLDDVFAPLGAATKRADVGFVVANGDGIQGDLSLRYRPAADGDTAPDATGLLDGTTDLAARFRALATAPDPAITTQPADQTANTGGTATFTIVATGTAPLTYQWRKDGVDLDGETAATLTLDPVATGDAAHYDCVVTSAVGTATSDAATLTVHVPPAITDDPIGDTYHVGETVILSVTATGDPTLAYQWRRNGVDLDWEIAHTLNYLTTTIDDSGDFDCVVTNAYGTATSAPATIVVHDVAPLITGGTIGYPPDPYTVGDDIAPLTVEVTGLHLHYAWKKDDVPLDETGSTLDLGTATDPSQSGVYTVIVSNSGGDTSTSVTITVRDVAPVITGGTITDGPVTYTVGDSIDALTVEASGENLHYAWKKDGAPLGETSDTLSLGTATSPSQSGTYAVTVSNTGGSDSKSVTITVHDVAPVITGGTITDTPVPYTVGDSIDALTVEASGENLHYAWKKDGAPLGETSDTLSLGTATSPSQSGTYTVTVSNTGGSDTKSVTITVHDAAAGHHRRHDHRHARALHRGRQHRRIDGRGER